MAIKHLYTLRGTAAFDTDDYDFEVIEGGALRITGPTTTDLIAPGFWIALLDDSDDRLDWRFLSPE